MSIFETTTCPADTAKFAAKPAPEDARQSKFESEIQRLDGNELNPNLAAEEIPNNPNPRPKRCNAIEPVVGTFDELDTAVTTSRSNELLRDILVLLNRLTEAITPDINPVPEGTLHCKYDVENHSVD
jgi:hypothetical protein